MKLLYHQETKGCRQETVGVKKTELVKGLLAAEIPTQLELMPDAVKDLYYPYENRPEMIWSDSDGSVQMTFQLFDNGMAAKETGNAAEEMREWAEKQYPHSKKSPVYMFGEGGIPIGWFVMDLEQDSVPCCHVKAIFPVHGQMSLATVTYPEQEQIKWRAVLKHFFVTFR